MSTLSFLLVVLLFSILFNFSLAFITGEGIKVKDAAHITKVLILCWDSVECTEFTMLLSQRPHTVAILDLVPGDMPNVDEWKVSNDVQMIVIKMSACKRSDLCSAYNNFHPDILLLFVQDPFPLSQILPTDPAMAKCDPMSDLFQRIDVLYGTTLLGSNLIDGWVAYEHLLYHEREVLDEFNSRLLHKEHALTSLLSGITQTVRKLHEYNRANCDWCEANFEKEWGFESQLNHRLPLPYRYHKTDNYDATKSQTWISTTAAKLWNFYHLLAQTGHNLGPPKFTSNHRGLKTGCA